MESSDYDLIVIGGGAGGTAAALRAAQLGGHVALIEESHVGGFCMNKGCIPFSQMSMATEFLRKISSLAKDMGIQSKGLKLNLSTLNQRQCDLIDGMREGIKGLLSRAKVQVKNGKAEFVDSHTISLKSKKLTAQNIIIATGSRWAKPNFPVGAGKVCDGDYLLDLKKISGKFLLISDNPFSLQAAQFLATNGARVSLATTKKRPLYYESKPISTRMTKMLRDQGIDILTKSRVLSCEAGKSALEVTVSNDAHTKTITVDRVVYMKKVANLEGLALDKIGLRVGEFIEVNDRMETGIEGVYAIGDVTSSEEMHYSHLASAAGVVAAENCMGLSTRLNPDCVPRVLYTTPQVACVGMSAAQAKAKGHDVVTGAAPLGMNPFGMITTQTYGIIEIVAEKKYGEILGVNMIGDGICEMAGQAVLAIQLEATLEDLAKAIFPHPTISESLAEAARDCLGQKLYLP